MRHGTAREVAALALVVGLSACGDGPTTPDGPAGVNIRVVSGDGQRTLEGWPLDRPVLVQTVDAAGAPVGDVVVRFRATHGGSTSLPVVSTSGSGLASVRWTLGSAENRTQDLTVSTQDGSSSVTLSATSLPPDEAETIVVHGALAELQGFVLVREADGLEVVGARSTTDTVLHVPPQNGSGAQVIVFGRGNRPTRSLPAWSSGVDTVHVELLPPVAVDIEFVIQAGSFGARRSQMLTQLAATEAIWRDQGMGIELGQVTFVDDTEPVRTVEVFSSAGICSGGLAEGAIRVDLVTSINGGQWTGWGCWNGQIYMALGSERFPNLLAHEIGHTFTLEHTPSGLMFANQPGSAVTDGETFRAHFHAQSVLNTIFESQPATSRRQCHVVPSPCLPEGLDLARGVITLADRPGPLDRGHGEGARPAVPLGAPVDANPPRGVGR